MSDSFFVTRQYDYTSLFTSGDLVECVRFAAAAALHTGRSFGVHRQNRDASEDYKSPLLSIGANHIDFRQVREGTPLVMKAFAHELVENIDELVPQIDKDGPLR